MLAWTVLLFLVVAEAIGLKWWASKQFRPFFFSDWAAFLYSALLAVDIAVAWLISMYETGGAPGMDLVLMLCVGLCIILGLATLFFRWVIRLDMTDISKKDNQR